MQLAAAGAGALSLVLLISLPKPCPAAYPPSAEGASYAVATDNADATRAAIEVMASGGNAVDGAIAAALTLGVVSPTASGLGGGGFALVYTAKDQKVVAVDFRERAPASYDGSTLFTARPHGPSSGVPPWTGPRGVVVGVPGEPAGLEHLSKRFGKKSLSDVAAPAVALATQGFYASKHLADLTRMFKDRLVRIPTLDTAFVPGGAPAAFGSRIKRPELAATLARFGAEGKKSIYEGPTAAKIADAVHGVGGTMTKEDLSSYAVKERAPLSRTVDGRTIYAMPAPSAGGLMVVETLAMFGANKSSALAPMGFGSSAYLHTLAEAMRGAMADRGRLAGDPDIDPNVNAAFQKALEPAQLAARRAKIDPQKTHAPTEFKTKEQGTTHLVVADAEGNVVALTTTVNGPFGAGLIAGDTGILLNNELDDFTSPDDAKPFGFTDGGPNRPRPKARPISSMSPTIVVENGMPILALGGSGGSRIATGTTQAALARLVFDLDPAACVSHPRIHTQGVDLFVDREIPADVRDGLKGRGETVKEEPWQGSGIQMIAWQRPQGGPARLSAASDPRKGGFSAAR